MSGKQTGVEVERVDGTAVVLIDEVLTLDAPADVLAAVLAGAAEYEPASVDAAEVTEQIIAQMLAAQSEDELYAEPTTWNSKHVVGQVFVFGPSGQINKSSIVGENGRRGVFLSVEATDPESGETGIFNTSSPRIIGRLAWYSRNRGLPKLLKVVEHGRSSSGFVILDVIRTDKAT
jgi:hypothetical protein